MCADGARAQHGAQPYLECALHVARPLPGSLCASKVNAAIGLPQELVLRDAWRVACECARFQVRDRNRAGALPRTT